MRQQENKIAAKLQEKSLLKSQLEKLKRKAQKKKMLNRLQCQVCQKSYANKATLQFHLKSIHKIFPPKKDDYNYYDELDNIKNILCNAKQNEQIESFEISFDQQDEQLQLQQESEVEQQLISQIDSGNKMIKKVKIIQKGEQIGSENKLTQQQSCYVPTTSNLEDTADQSDQIQNQNIINSDKNIKNKQVIIENAKQNQFQNQIPIQNNIVPIQMNNFNTMPQSFYGNNMQQALYNYQQQQFALQQQQQNMQNQIYYTQMLMQNQQQLQQQLSLLEQQQQLQQFQIQQQSQNKINTSWHVSVDTESKIELD